MQVTPQTLGGNTLMLIVLGISEVGIVAATLANVQLPLIGNPRIALIALVVIGMAMCSMGMELTKYGWGNPFNVIGTVLGVIMLIIGMAAIFGISLPLITSEREAMLALAVLMVIKVVIAGVRGVVS